MSGLSHAQVRRILELVDSMTAESIEVEVEGFRLRVERSEVEKTEERDLAPPPEGDAVPLGVDDVEDVLALIESAGFDVVELETPDFKTAVRRSGSAPAPAAPEPRAAEPEPSPAPPASGNGASPTPKGMLDITAPMVGTFYRSRSPGSPPFIEVGSSVSEETEVCIIEAMKLMNYIPAGVRGTVTEVLADNEQAVESGTPLFRVDPDGA